MDSTRSMEASADTHDILKDAEMGVDVRAEVDSGHWPQALVDEVQEKSPAKVVDITELLDKKRATLDNALDQMVRASRAGHIVCESGKGVRH